MTRRTEQLFEATTPTLVRGGRGECATLRLVLATWFFGGAMLAAAAAVQRAAQGRVGAGLIYFTVTLTLVAAALLVSIHGGKR